MTGLPHTIPDKGSKRKLAALVDNFQPKRIKTFYEPFCGSAAMTIHATHHRRARRTISTRSATAATRAATRSTCST